MLVLGHIVCIRLLTYPFQMLKGLFWGDSPGVPGGDKPRAPVFSDRNHCPAQALQLL